MRQQAAVRQRGAHGVAEQGDAQMAREALAHLAFDAGEGGVGWAAAAVAGRPVRQVRPWM